MATKSSTSIPSTDLTSNSTLNDQLNETEIGSLIAKNKTLAVIAAVALVLGVIGYGVYNAQRTTMNQNKADQMFTFMDANFQNFVDGKMQKTAFIIGHQNIM